MMFRQLLVVVCCFASSCAVGTEFAPWYGTVMEVDLDAAVIVEAYNSFATGHGTVDRATRDAFYALGASIAPYEDLSIQLEGIVGEVHRHQAAVDAVMLTGRKRWFNDIVADFASVSTGLTLTQVFHPGLINISAFYHGGRQVEFDLAVGKEFSCEQFWVSRIWGVAGCGIADHGSPWLRGNIAWEHNWWDNHEVVLYLNTLWGLGQDALNPNHFHGYGPINHQSIDLGTAYRYAFDNGIGLGVAYSYRVFARNCPRAANFITLNLAYSFGL